MNIYLFLTIIVPPLGLFMAFLSISQRQKIMLDERRISFCIALFLAAFAYSYTPKGENPDIVRYFEFIDQIKDLPFFEAITMGVRGGKNMYFLSAVCWVIGQIGDNYLLPAISVFFTYYIGAYVTLKISNDLKVNRINTASVLLLVIFTPSFYSITNNVRNILAFAIVGYGVFRDLYLRKRNIVTILLYILPIFLHFSAITIVLLRFIILFKGKWKVIFSVLAISLKKISTFMYFSFKDISYDNTIVELLKQYTWKAHNYFNDTTSQWGLIVQQSGSYTMKRYLYVSFAMLFCIISFYVSGKIEKNKINVPIENKKGFVKMLDFSFYLGLLTVACMQMLKPEFWRFASVLLLFSAPVIFVSILYVKDRFIILLTNVLFVYMPLCLALTIRDLRLSYVGELLFKPFISSPIIIVVKNFIYNIFC